MAPDKKGYPMSLPYVDLLKWAPIGFEVISEVGKLYSAIQAKLHAKDSDTEINANKEIDKRSEKLIGIGHGFLPADLKDKAEVPEISKFKDSVINVVSAVQNAIEDFLALLK